MQLPMEHWEAAKRIMVTIELKGATEPEGEVAIDSESEV
jgi:hypothetical protein